MTAETLGAGTPRAAAGPAGEPLLKLDNVHTYYGQIHALKGVTIEVNRGEVVTLIGANGAGKTTTLKTVCGLLHPRQGTVTFDGKDVSKTAAHNLVKDGIGHAPEGRRIFSRLTVLENLQMGGFTRTRAETDEDVDRIMTLFPRLKERTHQQGGTLSGGEQQMLAIGRAIMSRPRLLLLDEPSLGLAPQLIQEVFRVLAQLRAEWGLTMLLVEQSVVAALDLADGALVLETGRVALRGTATELAAMDEIRSAYLGS